MSEPPRRDSTEAVTWPVRVAAAWTWRVLLIGLGIYVLARIFMRLEVVTFSFVIALFFTAVLHPLELGLRRLLPGPRSVSAALALLIGLAELGDQITRFVHEARNWLRNGPLHLNAHDLDRIANNITASVRHNQGQLISGAIQTVRTVAEALGALLLVLLSTFFLLRDGDMIWGWVLRLFPRRAQERIDVAGRIGWHSFGGYMRGQVIIALFHGVSVTILLFVLHVPLAAALGVLIFLGSFVPLVGLTVTGALCVAVAGLEHGLTAAVVVAIAIIVLVQLEAHFLQPVIMSRSVQVHPLAIALSVITGTLLAGIVGALLAVPLVAFLNSTISALRHGEASSQATAVAARRRLGRRSRGESPPESPPESSTAEPEPEETAEGPEAELPTEAGQRSDGSADV
jgi:putative heme transporter